VVASLLVPDVNVGIFEELEEGGFDEVFVIASFIVL